MRVRAEQVLHPSTHNNGLIQPTPHARMHTQILTSICLCVYICSNAIHIHTQEERERRAAIVMAACDAHKMAAGERECSLREAALEAAWDYKTQSVEQDGRWLEMCALQEEAAAERQRVQEAEEHLQREMEGVCEEERARRERDTREEVMEEGWVRRAVAAEQEDVWMQKVAEVREGERQQARRKEEREEKAEEERRVREKKKVEEEKRVKEEERIKEDRKMREEEIAEKARKMREDEKEEEERKVRDEEKAEKERTAQERIAEARREEEMRLQKKEEEDAMLKKEEEEEEEQLRKRDCMRAEEEEGIQRVRETSTRLEAAQREKGKKVAQEREECATNRMSALARERAHREEAEDDGEWRAAVRGAQEERVVLVASWERERDLARERLRHERDAEVETEQERERERMDTRATRERDIHREREAVKAEVVARKFFYSCICSKMYVWTFICIYIDMK